MDQGSSVFVFCSSPTFPLKVFKTRQKKVPYHLWKQVPPPTLPEKFPGLSRKVPQHFWNEVTRPPRAPADHEVYIKDSGFTRTGLGVTVVVCTLPPDQEEALAWQRQSGPGAERDSWSCSGMV